MPFLSNSESSETASSRDRTKDLRAELQDQLPVLDNQAILDESGVRASFLNNTSLDKDRFDNELSAVAGFPEGRVIEVTYFSRNYPFLDTHSHVADVTTSTKDDVHISWTQIRNFELRLSTEISFNYERDTNVSAISGEALVFAGFEPHVNDIFIYKMRNGKIGCFVVNDIERTGLGHDTYHRIKFGLDEWVDAEIRNRLQRQTTTVMYFDKTKFVAGNHALLSTEGYIQQNDLTRLRHEVIRNYIDRFYSSKYSSFIRPDDVYDPYVVEYWHKKVGYDETYVRPIQLLISMHGFSKTIWNLMTDGPIKLLENLDREYHIVTRTHRSLDTHLTALIDKNYIAVGKDMEGVTVTSSGAKVDSVDLSMQWDFGLPYYEYNLDAGKLKSYHDAIWDKMRIRFYGTEFPYQKCDPSVHYTSEPHYAPEDCNKCGNKACKYANHHPDYIDHLGELLQPPFPIRSNEELAVIFRRINRISPTTILNPSQEAQLRGYILWYRETYPGTLSRSELDIQWRNLASIPLDKELTPEEEAALIEYIKSYRSQFLPVLTDREIEIVWRTKTGVGYNTDLTDEQYEKLAEAILIYRDAHGNVPDDGYTRPVYPIGRALTPEEVKGAGAVHYDDYLLLSMTLRDFDLASNGIDPSVDPNSNVIPSDYLPKIYLPEIRGYRYCPSNCYYNCGPHSKKKKESKETNISNSYVLSNEFYLGSMAMSPFEHLLYKALKGEEIDIARVVEAAKLYLTWDDETAFYQHLCLIYLIDYALYWLRYHS